MKLLGLIGYKESGKDTVLDRIRLAKPHLSICRHNFADPLKDEVCAAFGITREHLEKHKPAYRAILQAWGALRRNEFGLDYWVLKWGNKFLTIKDGCHLVVATDVRFANEVLLIRAAFGKLAMVRRPGKTSDGHESEQLEGLSYDYIIHNDQSITNLDYQVTELLNKIM